MEIKQIWRVLHAQSQQFTKPVVIENAFDSEFLSIQDMQQYMAKLQQIPQKELDIRTYIEGGLYHNYLNKIQEETISKETTLEAWGSKMFDGRNYGMVINKAETINESLTSKFTSLSSFLGEIKNPLVFELDLALFIGNYGYTPFGIHQDGYNQSVIHFHIGPNPKTMYVWEPENYLKNGGQAENNFNIEEMLPYAQKYELLPNSVFFLPKKNYHIGYTKDFSIGCTIGLFESNKKDIIKNSLEHSLSYMLEKETAEVTHELSTITSILKTTHQKESLQNAYANYIEEYLLTLKSNCLFKSAPLKLKNRTLHKDDVICLKSGYRIQYKEEADKLIIYVRKKRLCVPNIPTVVALITQINSGDSFEVQQLIAGKPKALVQILKNIIEIIYINQAIEVNASLFIEVHS